METVNTAAVIRTVTEPLIMFTPPEEALVNPLNLYRRVMTLYARRGSANRCEGYFIEGFAF